MWTAWFLKERQPDLDVVLRTVPEIVFALIFVWAFGVGPLAGILAAIVVAQVTAMLLFHARLESIAWAMLAASVAANVAGVALLLARGSRGTGVQAG